MLCQHCKKNEQILSFHDGCALRFCDSSIIDANLRTNTLFSLFCALIFSRVWRNIVIEDSLF